MKYDIKSIEKRINKMNMFKKAIKEILYVLLIIFLYNVFLITMSSLNGTSAKEIFGYEAYIISSASMSPSINEGDVIVVRETSQKNLNVGDIITYKEKEEIITHRIIETIDIEGDTQYLTKGDNNNIVDDVPIEYKDIQGKVILTIPNFGKTIMLLENNIYIVIILLLILILLIHTKKVQYRKDKRREKKKIEDQKFKEKEI